MAAIVYLVSILFCALMVSVSSSPCYEDWIYNADSCYGFGSTHLSWVESAAICNLFGGDLTDIRSQSENDFIAYELRLRQVAHAWIGATDMFNDTNWLWTTTKQGLSEFSNWDAGDNPQDQESNCALTDSGHNYQWIRESCDHNYNFVCKTKPEGTVVG